MNTIRAEAPRVLADPDNYDARANIMWAGMPTTLAELDVDAADIPKMLPTLAQNKSAPFGAFKKMALEDAEAIYKRLILKSPRRSIPTCGWRWR